MKAQAGLIIGGILAGIIIIGTLFFVLNVNEESVSSDMATEDSDNDLKDLIIENDDVQEIIPELQLEKFTIEADDNGFYMNDKKISSLTVDKGADIEISFKVRTKNVYYGGLDFRGSNGIKTQGTKPGETTTFEFVGNKNFLISSFWPSSSVLKDTLKVNIQ